MKYFIIKKKKKISNGPQLESGVGKLIGEVTNLD